MNRSTFEQKKTVSIRLFVVLLVVALGALVFLYFSRNATLANIAALVNADYASWRVTAEKGAAPELPGVSLDEKRADEAAVDIYKTPIGFPIVSYSHKWTGDKLIEIYDELLKNGHGNEIKAVTNVIIYPGSAQQTGDAVAGTHVTKRSRFSVFFYLPGLVPESLSYGFDSTMSTIELYDMDKYDDVAQVSRTIAHEYGHHYTIYYFLHNDEAAKNSEYYRLRNVDGFGHEVFYDIESEYYENHMWSLYEIAAEDYVQLMGSSTFRQPVDYLDIYDVLNNYDKYENYKAHADSTTVNVYPQENLYLPLADEVDGLRSYFYSFIGQPNELEDMGNAEFNLTMTRYEKYGYPYYEITWNKTTQDPDALYTLVCYDKDGKVYLPIRTVRGDEEPVARVGTAVKISGTTITTLKNDVTNEDRYFKLYVLWPDGRMQSSEMFYADF